MIETSRLRLRSFRAEDWRAVRAYSVDPEVLRYVPGEPPSEEETREVIRSWMKGQADCPPHYDFAVTARPDDSAIGWCCIQVRPSDGRIGELMYVLNRGFWGRGYATEAARGVVGYGFLELKLRRIHAMCRPENTASWHVLEKLGMRLEGLLREHVWIRGQWRDSYLYAILDHEWRCDELTR